MKETLEDVIIVMVRTIWFKNSKKIRVEKTLAGIQYAVCKLDSIKSCFKAVQVQRHKLREFCQRIELSHRFLRTKKFCLNNFSVGIEYFICTYQGK